MWYMTSQLMLQEWDLAGRHMGAVVAPAARTSGVRWVAQLSDPEMVPQRQPQLQPQLKPQRTPQLEPQLVPELELQRGDWRQSWGHNLY